MTIPDQLFFKTDSAMILFLVAGGYVLTSIVLLKKPSLIHKPKNIQFRCRHISHRGGAGENLENTIAAFQHAVSVGTDMLELDCQLTKDGQVVVSHDNYLLRTTGMDAFISDLSYSELPLLKGTLSLDFDRSFLCLGGEDRRIPLLREVFERFPKTPINIDIKADNNELIAKVSELIIEFNREHLSVWGNFRDSVTNKCHKENPSVPVFFSLKKVILVLIFFYTGLLPFVPIKESLYEVLMPSVFLKEDKEFFIMTKKWRTVLWALDKLLMRKAIFEHLEKRGIQTYLWVLNDEDEYQRALEIGATGIMTDYPTKLKDFLENYAKTHQVP